MDHWGRAGGKGGGVPAFRGVRVCQQTQPGCWVNLTLQALRRGRQERAGAAERAAGAHLARLLLGWVRGGRLGGGLWASLPLSPRPLCAGSPCRLPFAQGASGAGGSEAPGWAYDLRWTVSLPGLEEMLCSIHSSPQSLGHQGQVPYGRPHCARCTLGIGHAPFRGNPPALPPEDTPCSVSPCMLFPPVTWCRRDRDPGRRQAVAAQEYSLHLLAPLLRVGSPAVSLLSL